METQPKAPLYIPAQATQMSSLPSPRLMLGLMGPSGSGKTFSALTASNVIVGNIDDNLTAHLHRTDVYPLDFGKPDWCRKHYKDIAKEMKYPCRDVLKYWLEKEGPKLTSEQVFFLDSWTTLQDNFDLQTTLEPSYTSKGSVDEFAFWGRKVDYSQEVMVLLKSLKCHVIVSFHEQETKDANGALIGKKEPLMQGKFVKKLGLYFTDFFYCETESILNPQDRKKIDKVNYYWRTKSTTELGLKSRLDLPMLIEPDFKKLLDRYFPRPK